MRSLAVIALCMSLTASHAQAPPAVPPKADAEPQEFKGKFLIVSIRTKDLQRPYTVYVLEKAATAKLGDRWFLNGTVVDMGGGTTAHAGSRKWLALSEVEEIGEFDKLQAIKDLNEMLRPR